MKTSTLYKLTNQKMQTHRGFQYTLGEKMKATGDGTALCTSGILHAYEHPLLAALHNPMHANIKSPRLFRCETRSEVVREGPLKCGSKTLTLIEEILLPEVTTEQCIRYAIGCALSVCGNPGFKQWAMNWLTGKDRSKTSAKVARAEVAWAAAWAAEATWTTEVAWTAARAAAAAWAAKAAAEEPLNLIAIAEWAMSDVIKFKKDK